MLVADRLVHTTCPYCGVGCQIDLHVRGDQILRVSGRFDNQVNFGNLCVKGRFGFDFVHAPDRLRAPLVRGTRQAAFRSTGWDEALGLVAERLAERDDEDLLVAGTPERVAEQLQAYAAAGADELVLSLLSSPGWDSWDLFHQEVRPLLI